MNISVTNNINDLHNITSSAIKNSIYGDIDVKEKKSNDNLFATFFDAAVSNINDTNEAISNKENEELKWAMGITENTHDLTIAVGKAETAMTYTIALRDKLLEAYKEIMQIQI